MLNQNMRSPYDEIHRTADHRPPSSQMSQLNMQSKELNLVGDGIFGMFLLSEEIESRLADMTTKIQQVGRPQL